MENTSEEKKCESCESGACSGKCGSGEGCSCPHHKAIPVFVILIAFAFLLSAWDLLAESTVAIIWPILLAAIGFTKLTKGKCKCC